MDAGAHERRREAVHAVVSAVKLLLAGLVASSLLAGVLGGLLRAGVHLPGLADRAWLGQALVSHAALMICGFFGSVIGIERAVAVKLRVAFAVPLACGAATISLLGGHVAAAGALLLVAAVTFVAVNIVIVRRQRAAHTIALLASALAWLVGNGLFAVGGDGGAILSWWFAFLVLTIAAERLEMTRLMRHRRGALPSFCAIVSAMLAAAAWASVSPAMGGVLYGLALALLAAWLVVFDIARRTVTAHGLSRYMAMCLLGGYGWLAIAGAAWAAMSLGFPTRDIALHALGLGFVMSMVMAHAPMVLPAIARVKLQFGWPFYLPVAALHASLAIRLGLGATHDGALLNAAALALFAITVLGGALAWRPRRRTPPVIDSALVPGQGRAQGPR